MSDGAANNVFDPSIIDVDLTPPDGVKGYLDTPEQLQAFGNSRRWPSTLEKWDRGQWRDAKREQEKAFGPMLQRYNLPIDRPGWLYLEPWLNQSPESTCVHCNASCCHRYLMARNYGSEYLIYGAPMSSYAMRSRPRNAGDYMGQVCEHMQTIGQLPAYKSNRSSSATMDEAHRRAEILSGATFRQNTPYARKSELPENWERFAKYIRVTEWIALATDDEIASAMLHRLPILTGRQGHSITYCDLVFDDRGNPLAEYLDSYGPERGNNGRLVDTPRVWMDNPYNTFAALQIWKPNHILQPFGEDTVKVDKATLRSLYPRVSDETFDQLYETIA